MIDVNGTHYKLLQGESDWRACTLVPGKNEKPQLEFDHCQVMLRSRAAVFITAPLDLPPTIDQRRGAAIDQFDNVYWIDDSQQALMVNSAGSNNTSIYWSQTLEDCDPPEYGEFTPRMPSEIKLLKLAGLTINSENFLIVGVTYPMAGLLVFDLFGGGPPTFVPWSIEDVKFEPFDMAAQHVNGGFWVLDRQNRRYWEFDRRYRVVPRSEDTLPVETPLFRRRSDGAITIRQPARRRSLADAVPVEAVDPIAIETIDDQTVIILDRLPVEPFSRLYRYRDGVRTGDPYSLDTLLDALDPDDELPDTADPTKVPILKGHDVAYLKGSLYLAAGTGNQVYRFEYRSTAPSDWLQPKSDYLPMRLFAGKALISGSRHVYYDYGDRWAPLVKQNRPRFVPLGMLETPGKNSPRCFDGYEPGCVWHRLLLDGHIPAGTDIIVESRASDNLDLLDQLAWQPEPRLYRRHSGTEQVYVSQSGDWQDDTWELLFQQARGRYLQLRLTFKGDGRQTPRARAMRVSYPRFSYLEHYLPAIYRDDAVSASFMDRFLANTEGFLTTLEDHIASVQMLFDPRSIPPEFLDWLASWFGVAMDANWENRRRRLFLRHIMTFFQYRGTRRGLLMALRLALDEVIDDGVFTLPDAGIGARGIRIIERFRARESLAVQVGDPTDAIRELEGVARWSPEEGRSALIQSYVTAAQRYGFTGISTYPVRMPGADPEQAFWLRFSYTALGFRPLQASEIDADMLTQWRRFLEQRYIRIEALNAAYHAIAQQQAAHFEDLNFPQDVPADGAALDDWTLFQRTYLSMQRDAHRFTVLIPVPLNQGTDAPDLQMRLDRARRVIDLEAPAHTNYEVKFFWALFRVGDARLGQDTQLDEGARLIIKPLLLGQGYLLENYLAAGHPQTLQQRWVVGRHSPPNPL
jgi:phage tail-like protein